MLTQGRGALRESARKPPPAEWAEMPEFDEPHRRGEVLVAVVFELLVEIWSKRLQPLLSRPNAADGDGRGVTVDRARAAEEGARAASQLLTMLIRGLDYLPPVEFDYGDLLNAVVLADAEVVPDDDLGYRDLLIERFEAAGIERPQNRVTDVLDRRSRPPHYLGINYAGLRSDRDEVFRFLWLNARRLDICTDYYTVIESVLPTQRIGPDGLVVPESVATYLQMVNMTAREFTDESGLELPPEIDPGTSIQLFGGGTLVFDQFGRLKLHIFKPLTDWERQKRRLRVPRAHRPPGFAAASGVLRGHGTRPGVRPAAQQRPELRGGMVSTPVRVRVRMYQVGFGDCFLRVGGVRRSPGRRPRRAAPAHRLRDEPLPARGDGPWAHGRCRDAHREAHRRPAGRARGDAPAPRPSSRLRSRRGRRHHEEARAEARAAVVDRGPRAVGDRRRAG